MINVILEQPFAVLSACIIDALPPKQAMRTGGNFVLIDQQHRGCFLVCQPFFLQQRKLRFRSIVSRPTA
jgi:hypothetical protein